MALAAIGDVRAVPTLAKRLRMDPLKICSDQDRLGDGAESATTSEARDRVAHDRRILRSCTRTSAPQIAEQAEDAVIFWIHEMPSPHANGLRALAAMESTKDIDALRKWANPDRTLPKEGQQPPCRKSG